jgi:hypothetical protein
MYSSEFERTIELFSQQSQVDCIVLGGSHAVGNHDAHSDFDVYVYLNAPLPVETRKFLLSETCNFTEMNNTFWEPEDDCILKSGEKIEMIYVNIAETRETMHRILVEYSAGIGFSTCTCFSVLNAKILHDPHGIYHALVKEFSIPYPEQLRKNIIKKNYDSAISKTAEVEHCDLILITRRIVAFMNSYFDIIYAVNKAYVPGEKYMEKLAIKYCKKLPENFSENLNKLLTLPKTEIKPVISKMIEALDIFLEM